MTAVGRGHRPRRRRAQRPRHRRLLGGRPCAGQQRHRPDHPLRRRPPTRPASPARCPASTPRSTCPSRLLPQTDRMTRLALVAARLGARRRRRRPGRAAPSTTWAWSPRAPSGGFEFGQGELQNLWSKGGQYVSAYQSFAWFYAVNTRPDLDPQRHARARAACSSATRPAASTRSPRRAGRSARARRLIVSGGVDASICPWGWVAQLASGRLSTSDDPARAYLPFDAEARGHVPGEGGAMLVLEDAESRRATRGAAVYGEIAGYAATFDPAPGQRTRARRCAGPSSSPSTTPGVPPDEIDVVFADAAGVARAGPGRGRGASTAVFGAARRPGHRAQDDDRPAATPAPRHSTWPRRCWPSRDGVIPPTVNVDARPRATASTWSLDAAARRAACAPRWCSPAATAASTPPWSSARLTSRTRTRTDAPTQTKGTTTMTANAFTLDDLRRILLRGRRRGRGRRPRRRHPRHHVRATLGYESLALLETGSRIEREYGIDLDDDDAHRRRAPRAR